MRAHGRRIITCVFIIRQLKLVRLIIAASASFAFVWYSISHRLPAAASWECSIRERHAVVEQHYVVLDHP